MKPSKENIKTKKYTMRMPPELYIQFKKRAVEKERSMSSLLIELVKEFLKGK